MNEQEILERIQKGLIVPDTRPLSEYVFDNVDLPDPPYSIGGPFDIRRSLYLKDPMDALTNPKVKQVINCGAPRTAKSLIQESFLYYTLQEDPGDILLITQTKEKMKDYYDARLSKFLKGQKALKFSSERYDTKKNLILFPQANLKMGGGQNEDDMTMLGFRYVIGDELWRWKQGRGLIEQFKTRTTEFPHSKKILLSSQASHDGDEFHKEWLKGHQADWGFRCPHCHKAQVFVFSDRIAEGVFAGVNWDPNAKNKETGEWNIKQAEESAHYVCIGCRHKFFEKDKRTLNDCGLYISSNKNAPEDVKSFRWNAIASLDITFAELVREWLTARIEAKRGRWGAIKTFYMQRLSDFWRDGLASDEIKPVADISLANKEWPEEYIRILSCDVQEGGGAGLTLFYEVWAYSTTLKEARQIAYGTTDSFDALDKIREEHRVRPYNVMVDCGFKRRDVQRECAKHGKFLRFKGAKKETWACWQAVFGDTPKDDQYYHKKIEGWRWYSERKKVDPNYGTKEAGKMWCMVFKFSDTIAQDCLDTMIKGKNEWKWIILEEALKDPNYIKQLNAEKKKPITLASGKVQWKWIKDTGSDNNFRDTSKIQIVAASIAGLL